MEQQLLIQSFAAIFALFGLSRAYLRFKERKLSSFAFIFWVSVWIGGVLAVLFPDTTTQIANRFGIGRGADVVLYASIAGLSYLLFRVYIKLEDTQREITNLTRSIALSSERKSPKKKAASKK